MRVLLLGGFGYIGSTLTRHLLNNTEHKITILDTLEFGVDHEFFYNMLNHDRVRFIKGDVSDMSLLYNLIKKNDIVVDLAALTLPNSAKDPDDAFLINQVMVEIVGDTCKKLNKRMIMMSTCSNYGRAEKPVTENGELLPVSVYAISKVNAENYLWKNVNDVIILRCATAYGVGAGRTRWDVLFNDFVLTAKTKGVIDVFQPDAHRPICHVEDISKAIRLAIDFGGKHIFNIGSNTQNYTKRELVEIVTKHVPHSTLTLVEKDDTRDYIVDFSKAENMLGFKPDHSPGDTIAELLKELE